jgi:plastocyanin
MPRHLLLRSALASTLAVGLLAGPVTADPETDPGTDPDAEPVEEVYVPELRTEDVFFACDGSTGLAQVDALAAGPSSWRAARPTGSLAGGDGCKALDVGQTGDESGGTTLDVSFAGTHTGNLDALTVTLHGLGLSGSADLAVSLAVDGVELVDWPTAVSVPVVGTHDPTNGTVALTIRGIGLLAEDEAGEHDIALTVSLTGGTTVWAWDAADAPSGITFHPERPAATELVVGAPAAPGEPGEPGPGAPSLDVGPVALAGPVAQSFGYLTTELTMVEGMTLQFANGDQVVHDVVARTRDASGQRLFASRMIGAGEVAPVTGTQDLPAGTYPFFCSIHTGMVGTLEVVGLP